MHTEVDEGGSEGLVVEVGVRVFYNIESGGQQRVEAVGWDRRTGPPAVFGEIGNSLAGTE